MSKVKAETTKLREDPSVRVILLHTPSMIVTLTRAEAYQAQLELREELARSPKYREMMRRDC